MSIPISKLYKLVKYDNNNSLNKRIVFFDVARKTYTLEKPEREAAKWYKKAQKIDVLNYEVDSALTIERTTENFYVSSRESNVFISYDFKILEGKEDKALAKIRSYKTNFWEELNEEIINWVKKFYAQDNIFGNTEGIQVLVRNEVALQARKYGFDLWIQLNSNHNDFPILQVNSEIFEVQFVDEITATIQFQCDIELVRHTNNIRKENSIIQQSLIFQYQEETVDFFKKSVTSSDFNIESYRNGSLKNYLFAKFDDILNPIGRRINNLQIKVIRPTPNLINIPVSFNSKKISLEKFIERKKELKKLIESSRTKEVLYELRDILKENTRRHDEVILLLAELRRVNGIASEFTVNEKMNRINTINHHTINLINSLIVENFKA